MTLTTTMRGWHFEQMRRALLIYEHLIHSVEPEALTTFRDGGDGWTVGAVLCHLRDFELVFHKRALMTLTEDFADLPFPDPDQLAAEKGYFDTDPFAALGQWRTARNAFLRRLERTEGNEWQRAANHPKRGRFTLDDQLALTASHDVNHLEQVTRILRERRLPPAEESVAEQPEVAEQSIAVEPVAAAEEDADVDADGAIAAEASA